MDAVNPELLSRLPRTFVPALNEQLRHWDVLFPAERRTIKTQIEWLERLPGPAFDKLFEPLKALESHMELPAWTPATASVSINDTGVLVRSPLYPQWRTEVEKVFAAIDNGLKNANSGSSQVNRCVVCVMPPGAPSLSANGWPSLESKGRWINLERPFHEVLPALFDGVLARRTPAALDPVEHTWAFEYDSALWTAHQKTAATILSFEGLAALRREFLARINLISRDLRKADRVYEELRHFDLRPWFGAQARPDVTEFVRNLFLSGNGAVLFGNSFTEWGASEALRRAQPQALFCCFGVRPKLKPFSSVVLFEDQHRANPTPDQPDAEGSAVDCCILAEYVHLAAVRQLPAPDRVLTLICLREQNRLLALGNLNAFSSAQSLSTKSLLDLLCSWLA